MAVYLKRGSVSWDNDDHVIVKNAELIQTLIQDKDGVITYLSQNVSPVTLDKIVIDEHGTVIITDPAFKAKIESSFTGPGGSLDNHVCGVGCG